MTEPKTPILIDGIHHGFLLRDNPTGKALVEVGNHAAWINRDRVSDPASHLSTNETPQVANEQYRGIMGSRIERSKQ